MRRRHRAPLSASQWALFVTAGYFVSGVFAFPRVVAGIAGRAGLWAVVTDGYTASFPAIVKAHCRSVCGIWSWTAKGASSSPADECRGALSCLISWKIVTKMLPLPENQLKPPAIGLHDKKPYGKVTAWMRRSPGPRRK